MKIYWTGISKNVIGPQVKLLRKGHKPPLTQKALAEMLQQAGYEFDSLTILRIEKGTRFVPDYEVVALAQVLGVSYETLLGPPAENNAP